MTADEYRTAYAALGLTQAGAARLLGVDERTSRRWATGERDVPPPVSRFLTFLIMAEITADEVMKTLADGAHDAD
jgi:DNA-binding transcriptional regulator YiaG